MADRPIPFSAPMVRALIDGRKNQTRRIIKPAPWPDDVEPPYVAPYPEGARAVWYDSFDCSVRLAAPYAVGDRLYVREEYYQRGYWIAPADQKTRGGRQKWAFVEADEQVQFDPPADFRKGRLKADPHSVAWHKRLARFMPKRASRMTLIVDDVRVERLNDCSEEDALAEGVVFDSPERGFMVPGVDHPNKDFPYLSRPTAREMYAALWDVINGSGEWLGNPWVVALTFRVVHQNIDQVAA